jgi:hypothetical protein
MWSSELKRMCTFFYFQTTQNLLHYTFLSNWEINVLKNEIAAAQLQFFIKQNSANLVTYIAVSGAAANSRFVHPSSDPHVDKY